MWRNIGGKGGRPMHVVVRTLNLLSSSSPPESAAVDQPVRPMSIDFINVAQRRCPSPCSRARSASQNAKDCSQIVERERESSVITRKRRGDCCNTTIGRQTDRQTIHFSLSDRQMECRMSIDFINVAQRRCPSPCSRARSASRIAKDCRQVCS